VLLARLPCVDSAPRKRSGVSADLSVYRITGTVPVPVQSIPVPVKRHRGEPGHTPVPVPVRGETSSGRARCALVGRDGCEVRLCEPCALASSVSRVCPTCPVCPVRDVGPVLAWPSSVLGPGSPRCFFEPTARFIHKYSIG
jgi:hypothetical protein